MSTFPSTKKRKLLAVCSAGGHWIEMGRLAPAFDDFEVVYVSTTRMFSDLSDSNKIYFIDNPSRFDLMAFLPAFSKALRIMLKERPDAVVSTGAAPSIPFILYGRAMRCRTLWVDSIANTNKLSISGSIVRYIADVVVSQWPSVAEKERVAYWGNVL